MSDRWLARYRKDLYIWRIRQRPVNRQLLLYTFREGRIRVPIISPVSDLSSLKETTKWINRKSKGFLNSAEWRPSPEDIADWGCRFVKYIRYSGREICNEFRVCSHIAKFRS